jgi:hypothetical protein
VSIASFGNKVFRVSSNYIYTFDELNISGELETETQDVAKKKPSTYIKGPGLESMSFSIELDQQFGINVRNEIDSWSNIRDTGIPCYFILGNKPLRGCKWLLKSCEIEDKKIDSKGQITKANIKLSFEEFVRPGAYSQSKVGQKVAKAKKSAAKKNDASKTKKSAVPQRVNINSLINGSDKAAKTRNNPNASKAVQKGAKKK